MQGTVLQWRKKEGRNVKKNDPADRDPLASCSFCECARITDGDRVFCEKYQKSIVGRTSCSAYTYDLTKRRPLRLRSSCHLTEALIDSDL